ncbi:modulator of levamisole receptor-1 domain-containing protein [Ditylenchus destructor]|nr:modulator of levamisole receptor-1 domain-containing protein [Ditylenchus destructor]
MLSLLSLLLASTVLRADTEEWTPITYPNPRTNSTACNTWPNSTLCDPDHILTDHWRAVINENIERQGEKLKDANIQYTDAAPLACQDMNATEGVQIYVILAKRIKTPNNQSISELDMTNFGNELARKYGLDQQPCKNFLLLIGVETAKLAYVRTGKDLRLPPDLMQRVFHEYNLFNAKNYMEGLNKIVEEIGKQMADPFKELQDLITVAANLAEELATVNVLEISNSTNSSTVLPMLDGNSIETNTNDSLRMAPGWIIALMGCAIIMAVFSLFLLFISQKNKKKKLQLKKILARISEIEKTNGSKEATKGSPLDTRTDIGLEDGVGGDSDSRSNNENDDHRKTTSSISSLKSEIGPNDPDMETLSVNSVVSGIVQRPTTPTKTATRVNINADSLSTDVLQSKDPKEATLH